MYYLQQQQNITRKRNIKIKRRKCTSKRTCTNKLDRKNENSLNVHALNNQNESKISYRNKEIEDLKKNNGAMYSKLKYFEKILNIIKNISSYFPPLKK